MLKDLRYGLRMLLHAKGWTAVVVALLALGIGANTAIFSAMNAMLLTRIPVQDPDTLVRFRFEGRNQMATNSSDYGYTNGVVRTTFSYAIYQQFLKDNQTMTDLFARWLAGRVNVVLNGQAELATAFLATGNYFRVLGVNARIGRVFVPDDDRATAPPVAVISERYWRSRFGSDPSVVGKVISANLVQVTIVGVLPREFTGIEQPVAEAADVAFPVNLDPQMNPPPVVNGAALARLHQPTSWWLQIMGRLKPGATPEQVQGNLTGVFEATARAGLESVLAELPAEARNTAANRNRTAVPPAPAGPAGRARDLRRQRHQPARRSHPHRRRRACVADRLRQRRQPAAVARRPRGRKRSPSVSPLCATRPRLVRQMLVESVFLGIPRRTSWIAVAYWAGSSCPGRSVGWRRSTGTCSPSPLVVVLAGVVFGLAPAMRTTRADIDNVLEGDESECRRVAQRSGQSRCWSSRLRSRSSWSPAPACSSGPSTTCARSTSASTRRTWCSSASIRD